MTALWSAGPELDDGLGGSGQLEAPAEDGVAGDVALSSAISVARRTTS
jgi:hypothetical protein